MTTFQFVMSLIAIVVVFFFVGTLIGNTHNMYTRKRNNAWRVTAFSLPDTRKEMCVDDCVRSLSIKPNCVQYTITLQDYSITETFEYLTVKSAIKHHHEFITEVDEYFYSLHANKFKALKEQTK